MPFDRSSEASHIDLSTDRALVDALWSSPDVLVAEWDADLRYVRVNNSVALRNGASINEHVGQTIVSMAGAVHAEQLEPLLSEVLRSGASRGHAFHTVRASDGGVSTLRSTFFPICDPESNEARGVIGIALEIQPVIDVVEAAENEAEQAQSEAESVREEATEARDEYRRALHDYTQLMRHRLANPLAAILAGAATLQSHPGLPEDLRMQVLVAIEQGAHDLEQVVLHPHALSDEELGLEPAINSALKQAEQDRVEFDTRDQERQNRAGKNEAHFRSINQEIIEGGSGSMTFDCVCECSRLSCAESLEIDYESYRHAHLSEAHFVVLPQHNSPDIEHVIGREAEYWVVRKFGEARRAAEK